MALMPPKPCSALYYRSLSRARPPREAEPEQDLEQREQRQYREHQRRKAEQQRWRQHDPRLIGVGQQPVKAPLLARILVQRAREQDRRGEAGRQRRFRKFRRRVPRPGKREQPKGKREEPPGKAEGGDAPGALRPAFGPERRPDGTPPRAGAP